MEGLGDKKGTRGQTPCDAGRPCTEHAALGGGATEPQPTIVTSQTPTFCEWKESELKGDWGGKKCQSPGPDRRHLWLLWNCELVRVSNDGDCGV